MSLPAYHREFAGHAYQHGTGKGGRYEKHSHCPHCGNVIGSATTACAACGDTFAPSVVEL